MHAWSTFSETVGYYKSHFISDNMQACEMMLTSQPIKEGAAKKLGLVDDVVPKEKLLPAARQLALAIAAGKAPRSRTLYRTDKLEPLGEALAIIDFAKAQAAKKGAHLTHPQLCLDAIRWGVEFGGLKGIDKVGTQIAWQSMQLYSDGDLKSSKHLLSVIHQAAISVTAVLASVTFY